MLCSSQGLPLPYIPALLANLTALEILDLDGFSHADQLTVLGGVLPLELANLTNMTSFGVTGPLVGTIPTQYKQWTKLTSFRVSKTVLTGTIPAILFSSWPLLQSFSISGAAIIGTIPEAVFNNTALQELVVQHTPVALSSGLPPWFMDPRATGLTQMRAIGFGEFSAGIVPNGILGMAWWRVCNGAMNCVLGMPRIIQAPLLLTCTDACANQRRTHAPPHWLAGGTAMTLPSWPVIKNALKANAWALSSLSAPACGFTGPIGPMAFYFPQIKDLDLSDNQLTGAVLSDLGLGAAKLSHLLLGRNKLRGARQGGGVDTPSGCLDGVLWLFPPRSFLPLHSCLRLSPHLRGTGA